MTGLERRVRVLWWGCLVGGTFVITLAVLTGQWLAVPVVVWSVVVATGLRVLAAAVPDYVDTDEEYAGVVAAIEGSRHRLGRPVRR